MRPSDIAGAAQPSDVRLHPDGARAVFCVTRPDLDEDSYDRSLWLWRDGAEPRQFTQGPRDGSPRWSPDGSLLAFLRSPAAGKPGQVAVMPADGGEARVITDLPLGVSALEWSPTGASLAVVGCEYVDGWADLDDNERRRRPRRFTRAPFRADDRGWTHDRRRHIWLVDPVGTDAPRCLTPGDFDEDAIAWRPDGDAIVFLSDRHDLRGIEPGTAVHEVSIDTGEVRELVARGAWLRAFNRPDGVLHVVGRPDAWDYPNVAALYRLDTDGLTEVTDGFDRSIHPMGAQSALPSWLGLDLLAQVEDRGRLHLARVAPSGAVDLVAGGDRLITSFDVDATGARIVFAATTPTDPGELYVLDSGEERRVSEVNAHFREQVALVEPEFFSVTSDDGVDVDVWAFLPPGDGNVPVLLNIHGGPAAQYGFGFFDEFQVYAAAGFAVVACNPRGSTGRGREWVRGVVGDGWGTNDVTDVTAALDGALAKLSRLDPARQGVMGGSYGGFLTSWLIGRTDRFRSAVVERALVSWDSFSGTSDIGGWFSRMYLGADLPNDLERLWRASPLATASSITTPTLVVHSDSDFRCPIEQAERLFMALLRAGAPAEMLRFPDESHELSRSGKPSHRIERFDAILDWHERHLTQR